MVSLSFSKERIQKREIRIISWVDVIREKERERILFCYLVDDNLDLAGRKCGLGEVEHVLGEFFEGLIAQRVGK